MSITKAETIKIINQAKSIIDVLEINKLTNPSLATKYVSDAIKNQYTIVVIKTH